MLGRLVPWIGAAVAVATVLAGRLVDDLGTPHPPFLGGVGVRVHPLVVVAAAVLAGAVWAGPRLLRARPLVFAAAAFALTLAARLAVNAARFGVDGWDRVFDESFNAVNEYLPALPALRYGPHLFLDRFAELVPSLPVHAAGHPPGLLLVLDALGIATPEGMAALCVVVGALSVPLAYAAGARLLGDEPARVAALLLALSPGALLFGVSSADAIYLTLGLVVAWAVTAQRTLLVGVATAAVSFFAWSLPAIAAWGALLRWRVDGLRAAVALSLSVAVSLVVFYAAAYGLTGFDALRTLEATEGVYRIGVASQRPYWYWLFGSPVIFLLFVGLPVSWLALRALGAGHPVAQATFAVLAIAAVGGFTKAETERIWLFLAPLVCFAAATRLAPARLGPVLGALAAQALVTEVLFDTVW